MSKKIIFVKGQLETLDFFIDKLCVGADELGIKYYIMDVSKEETYTSAEFYEFVSSENVVMFTINQIGIRLMDGNENFWEKRGIPVYDLVVDHPYNYNDTFDNPIKGLHVFVIDRDHEDFIRKYYSPVDEIYFMPNGGWEVDSSKAFGDRTIDVFYAGDCNPKQPWVNIPFLSDGGKSFFEVCYNTLLENPFLPIEQVIALYCQECVGLPIEIEKRLILDYGFLLMHNVRRHFKLQAMHAIESTGAYIEVRGNGWLDDGEKWSDNVHIEGRVSSEECNRLSGNAKIGLNFMPWYKRGCSERVFNIMLNASVCLTDPSEYLLERFSHGEELVYFNYEDLDGLASDVSYLINNPEAAEAIAIKGYKVAFENDTWKHRMKEIYAVMNGTNTEG